MSKNGNGQKTNWNQRMHKQLFANFPDPKGAFVMDSSGLKNFAASWRSSLIGGVSARVGVVLAAGSVERVEFPGVVAGLESAISEAGGGEVGRRLVAERVAYLWFNRIVALRFMDVNGFTSVGVVSPAKGQVAGQPKVLADAKLGHFDSGVVDSKTASAVTGLLDGSRKSIDGRAKHTVFCWVLIVVIGTKLCLSCLNMLVTILNFDAFGFVG
ncbi:MAG: hypothetical protein V9G25_09450 [Acidimicrobiia bacterium]